MIDHEEIMMPCPQTQLSRARAGAYVLKVSGRLSPGWAGWLAQGLAHEGFNIERVSARRDTRGQWTAQLDFTRVSLGADPDMLDFAVLVTQQPAAGGAVMLRVWDCEVIGPSDDGSVVLSVVGPDQRGFLGAILEGLAFLSLFPTEMSIETDRGIARDRFVLRSTGGGIPSVEAMRALGEWLKTLIAGTIRTQKPVPPSDSGSDEALP